MIAKKTRGDRMRGLVLYLFGPGRHEEHRDPRLVAGWEPRSGDGRLTDQELEDLIEDLDAPRRLHQASVKSGYVWQCSLRNADDDRVLTDAEWGQIAHDTIVKLGFAAGCRWIAVRHADDHIHLAVSLIREDGRIASVWNDQRKLSAACADFETRYGLVVRAQRAGAGMPGLARAEIERVQRGDDAEAGRLALARKIRAAAAAARDEPDFVERARSQGLLLRARWAAGERREVVGYSVAAATDGSEPLIWFGGGKLAADLTLPRLRRRWSSLAPGAVADAWKSQGTNTHPPRTALQEQAWAQAGRVVADVRRRMSTLAPDDHAGWSIAAADAAGTLAALAGRVETRGPGPLSRAADELARAAGLPYTARTPQQERRLGMAGVARTASDAIIAARGGQAAVAILLVQLGRLVREIQEAHAAADRAAHARRAQLAAEQLLSYVHVAPGAPTDPGRPAQHTIPTSRPSPAAGPPQRVDDGRDR